MSHKTTLPSKGIGKTLQSKESKSLFLQITETTTRPNILSPPASFFVVGRTLKGFVKINKVLHRNHADTDGY